MATKEARDRAAREQTRKRREDPKHKRSPIWISSTLAKRLDKHLQRTGESRPEWVERRLQEEEKR